MDTMVQSLTDLGRPQDLSFFRATSPGHDGCGLITHACAYFYARAQGPTGDLLRLF
jgi:hypothetical protein